ncbi:MAG: hypothetical protein IT361_18490 [Gemmatimonadaceae bacterium]|nr:hypothetical protein [Gemmatimonadaceae bacterium]
MRRRTQALIAVCGFAFAGRLRAQGETIVVEQRVLLHDRATPAAVKRRALEEAMAEAVRRVAGVRVQSSAVSTTTEDRTGVRGEYRSVVQLDAAGRATDARLVGEAWESTQAPGLGAQVYYRASWAITVERETGTPDPAFTLDVSLPTEVYLVRGHDPPRNDELVAVVKSSASARIYAFSIVGDSVHALVPNAFVPPVEATAGARLELPDATWRARGLHWRVTLPDGEDAREELLAVVAVRGAGPPLPSAAMTVMEFQRWLVRIPAGDRATGFVPYDVRRASARAVPRMLR